MDLEKTKGAIVKSRGQWAVGSGQSIDVNEPKAAPFTYTASAIMVHGLLPTAYCLLFCFFLLTSPAKAAEHDGRWAIILSGVSGEPDLQKKYLQEISDLYSILTDALGFPKSQVAVLFDDPSKKPDLIQHKATIESLQELCRNLATRVKREDLVFVFIEGHGDYDGKTYKLNLVGPDPTAEELAAMLYSIPAQRFVVMNGTTCSGGSIQAL
jgi:hypothetical protein